MAGAGYKLFNTGDVLTAAQVNTYLMQQTVMVFASSAARTTALSGVLAEGMVSYLQDSNTLEVYDGSAWVGATGDITGLTAGTGITITNATGPVPTVTNDVVTTIDAKGDLIVGTGDNTYIRQAVGSNNQVLMADSAQSDGVKWANEATATLTAKGDILSASGANTLARLAVGSNGESIVADSSATTGLRWQGNFAAGKNKVINGDFGIWQRGTSSTSNGFLADRFNLNTDIASFTQSRQAFTPGTAPVAGYEGKFFYRFALTTLGAGTYWYLNHFIEDVQTLAGQTITFSFWAKADSARSVSLGLNQNFGSGGSSVVGTDLGSKTLSTSWTRYTSTVSLPSISGKTVGTSSYIQPYFAITPSAGMTIDIWGVQLEAGNTATAFQTATGTLAGELAACQRYYYLHCSGDSVTICNGYMYNATTAIGVVQFPVTMRTAPTSAIVTGTNYYTFQRNGAIDDCNSLTLDVAQRNATNIYNNTEIAGTAGHAGNFQTRNASAFVAFQAEL